MHADIVEQETIRYTLPVIPTQAAHFVRMTPMTFGLSEDILQDIQISHITIAMTLLICKPKRD